MPQETRKDTIQAPATKKKCCAVLQDEGNHSSKEKHSPRHRYSPEVGSSAALKLALRRGKAKTRFHLEIEWTTE